MPGFPLQSNATGEPIGTLGVFLLIAFVVVVTLLSIVLLRPSWTLPGDRDHSGEDDDLDSIPDPSSEIEWRREASVASSHADSSASHRRDIPPQAPLGAPPPQLPAWLADTGVATTIDALASISRVVLDLVEAGNRGDLAAGFALYTDEFRERFRRNAGLDDALFEHLLACGVRPPHHQISIGSLKEITPRSNDVVEAVVTYESDDAPPPPERLRFVRDPVKGWLIDDITTISNP